jgi:hypothetical protein
MRLTFSRTLIVAAAAILVAVLFPAVREFSAVDNCLDGGGVYDYVAGACRHDVEKLPANPGPWIRTPDFGSLSAALLVAAAFLVVFTVRDRSTGGSHTAVQRALQLTSTFRMRLRRNGDSVLAAELRR